MSRDDASLLDMIGALRKVIAWTQGMDKSAFLADERTQSAVQHQLAILGEAAKRLSPAFRDEHPEVPWRQIAGLRDVLVHRYDAVDLDLLWRAVSEELPALLAPLERLAPHEEHL